MTDVNNAEFVSYVKFLEGGANNVVRAFNHTTITVNLDGLKDFPAQLDCALRAMSNWTAWTGLKFVVSSAPNVDVMMDNERNGAATYRYSYSAKPILIDVQKTFYGIETWQTGNYGFETFVHEIGHSLGLYHGGNYNGYAVYSKDAIFSIDTRQYSVMSYFYQDELKSSGCIWENPIGPMIADIMAIRKLYGALDVNTGNTVYGLGETFLGGWTDLALHEYSTYCINDSAGHDLIDYSNLRRASTIDLRAGHFSDINGYKGNVSIAPDVVIEDAKGGSGSDTIIGNDADNALWGNAGNDTLIGGKGRDMLDGGTGADTLDGGEGGDTYYVDNTGDRIVNEAAGALPVEFKTAATDWLANHARYVAGGEMDTVYSTVSYTLADNVEELVLRGTGRIGATGNAGDNGLTGNGYDNTLSGLDGDDGLWGGAGKDRLLGGNGNDWLDGGYDVDTLTGGAGADYFVLGSVGSTLTTITRGMLGASYDVITDFSRAEGDKILLSLHGFHEIAGHAGDLLSADQFASGLWARDRDDRMIYDGASGQLWYDDNGSALADGWSCRTLVAKFAAGTHLDASDFMLIA